jgi:predicted permease
MNLERPRRYASRVYRHSLRRLQHGLPTGSTDEAVQVFEDLQHDAARSGGWWALARCWVDESMAVRALRRSLRSQSEADPDSRGRSIMSVVWLEQFADDLRHSGRVMRGSRGFMLTAVLTLAVGIGASTAIFSLVNAVLLRPLPYHDAGRLATLWTDDPKHDVHEEGVSYPTFNDWGSLNRSFDGLAFFSRANPVTLTSGNEPERVESSVVSADFLGVLGVRPELGRDFSPDDVQRREPVIVLSHALWQRRFGASPTAIGSTLEVDGVPRIVIGVMPASFQFPSSDVQLWEQLTGFRRWRNIEKDRYSDWGRVIGRLKPSVTVAAAQLEMGEIGQRLERAYPPSARDADFAGFGVNVVPLTVQITGRTLPLALWVLFGGVLFVLLIACVNVANLLLSRGAARERELALRHALGAGRARIVRQLLTESLLLALVAEAVGVGLAVLGVRLLVAFAPSGLPHLDAVRIDSSVLAFASVISLVASVLFGLMPALRLSKISHALARRAGQTDLAGRRLRALLVIGEFALSVVLLCGAGLFIRSFQRVQAIDPGFRAEGVLTMRVTAAGSDADAIPFYSQVIERIGSLPGVKSVGVVEDLLQRRNPDYQVMMLGHDARSSEPLSGDAVSPDYFKAAGVQLLKGRLLSDGDRGGPPVAIINETMARHLWPGEEPVGKQFREIDALPKHPWYVVVGVIADTRRQGLERQPIAQAFWPYFQRPSSTMDLVIRTSDANPTRLAPTVRQELRSIDKRTTVFHVSTLEHRLDESLSPRRFQSLLLIGLAAIALGLAAIGVYALMHYSVAQRTTEIGVRLTLGAQKSVIVGMIMREGLVLAAVGVTVGLVGALVVSRLLSTLLFDISATDPLTFGLVPTIMGAAAVLASSVPAWRATTVDPMLALRRGQ